MLFAMLALAGCAASTGSSGGGGGTTTPPQAQPQYLFALQGDGNYAGSLATWPPDYLYGFSVNPSTGAVTEIGQSLTTDAWETGKAVATTSGGSFLYLLDGLAGAINGYSVNSTTGVLTQVASVSTGYTFPNGKYFQLPMQLSLDPSNKYLRVVYGQGIYYASLGSETYFFTNLVYAISPATGALTQIGSSSNCYTPIAVDAKGAFAYCPEVTTSAGYANTYPNDLWVFTVNSTTGALTQTATSPTSAPVTALFPSPTAEVLYGLTSKGITAFSINSASGSLTVVGNYSVPADSNGGTLDELYIDPTGTFLYAGYSNSAATGVAFSINASTGALTSISNSGYPGGPLVFNSTGTFAYSGNSAITTYSVNRSTGVLTQSSSLPFSGAYGTGGALVFVP